MLAAYWLLRLALGSALGVDQRLSVVTCVVAGMRKNCLMVLSHLILNDMMKVKGHIARLALCLQDPDERVAGLAQVFFHELSRKAFKVGLPLSPLVL